MPSYKILRGGVAWAARLAQGSALGWGSADAGRQRGPRTVLAGKRMGRSFVPGANLWRAVCVVGCMVCVVGFAIYAILFTVCVVDLPIYADQTRFVQFFKDEQQGHKPTTW